MARCKLPDGDMPQSDVGGVVGGVIGSDPDGELAPLSSVKPSESKPWVEVDREDEGPLSTSK